MAYAGFLGIQNFAYTHLPTPEVSGTSGQVTSDGTKTYIYDGDNRLIEVKEGASTIASYTYDYMGRRTSSTESGNTTYYHYDGWNVVAETDEAGSTIATYAYDNSNQPISMTRGTQTYYYQTNAHGDVVTLTDSTGAVVNTYAYDPWGQALSSSETVPNPYRYAGYRYDAATELYYLQKRYYSPRYARFLTADLYPGELERPTSLNYYQYVGNNPISYIDPSGLDYADLNIALPIGYGFLVTGGIISDENGTHFYGGLGWGTPGISLSRSSSEPVPGWNKTFQAGKRGAYLQVGLDPNNQIFWEEGGAIPGASGAVVYIGKGIPYSKAKSPKQQCHSGR